MADPAPEPPKPVERILEQAYFHISNSGMTLSIVELQDADGNQDYRFKHRFDVFGTSTEASFPLGSTDIVSWMTMALNRISMRVAGAYSARGNMPRYQSFDTPVSVKVQNGVRKASILRIAARYKQSFGPTSMEFDTQKEMENYLKEHPGANKSLHHVKPHTEKPETSEPETEETESGTSESKPEDGKPKKTFKQRLQSLSDRAKHFVSNAPSEIKEFVVDDAHRRDVLMRMHKRVENLPHDVYRNAKHSLKEQAHEFKTAAHGVKSVLSGTPLTKEEKHAFKEIAMDAALAVAISAVTGGFGASATGAAEATAGNFARSVAKKIALNSVTRGLGRVTKIDELAHFGHGVFENAVELMMVTSAEGRTHKADESDLVLVFIMKLVSDELKDLDPDVLAEAVEDAAKAAKAAKAEKG